MKNLKFSLVVLFSSLIMFSACKDDNNGTEPDPPKGAEVISGNITTNTTLTADKVWTLEGYVRVLDGATLTVEPGTIVKGKKAAAGINSSALIIERGGKIIADGTAENPIIFTSSQLVGSRSIGDWAGIIVCGRAGTNISGGVGQYESGILGADVAQYGSATPVDNDNSGIIRFVRIEYAGVQIQQDKEINGLTLCAVGSGTVVENVQVSYGGDDAFEFFGGTVNCKNLIAYRSTDDDFDFEFGYRGTIQFAISMKDPNIADAAGASNGIECDNGVGEADQPYNKPVLSNFTFIGPGAGANDKHNSGVLFRKGTQFVLVNSIIVNHLKGGVEIATAQAGAFVAAGQSVLKNNLVFAIANPFKVSSSAFGGDAAAFTALATDPANGNTILADAAAAGITSIDLANPNPTLTATSPAKTGASFTGLPASFQQVTYRGAADTNNWAAGWSNFDPANAVYE